MKPRELTGKLADRLTHGSRRTGRPTAAARLVRSLWVGLLLAGSPGAFSQTADFQIVWVVIGEAAASAGDQPARAGRHLFMASQLASFSLKNVTVARIDAEPVITNLRIGQGFCLASLKIIASGPDRSIVKHAPMSISIRQDHKDALDLDRRKDNICVRPTIAGEFPIRFTSLLPAADGSTRGAQIFIRVRDVVSEGGITGETTGALPLSRQQHRFVVW